MPKPTRKPDARSAFLNPASTQRFINAWNGLNSRRGVAAALGLTIEQVQNKVQYLRSKGVILRQLRKGRKADHDPRAEMARAAVTDEEFVKVWLISCSIREVAEKLKWEYKPTYYRSQQLRKKGVQLPRMPHQTRKVDVAGLNRLIKNHRRDK